MATLCDSARFRTRAEIAAGGRRHPADPEQRGVLAFVLACCYFRVTIELGRPHRSFLMSAIATDLPDEVVTARDGIVAFAER